MIRMGRGNKLNGTSIVETQTRRRLVPYLYRVLDAPHSVLPTDNNRIGVDQGPFANYKRSRTAGLV